MRLFNTIAFICLLQQATCKEPMEATGELPNKVLHALPEFVSGDTLAALKSSVLNQFDNEGIEQRCLPSSCVLPQATVSSAVGEKMRQALALAESIQPIDKNIQVSVREETIVYLPALRTELGGRNEADFHDDFDVDEPRKEATWTALLYLDASSGDRFKVRLRDNPQYVESHEIQPGTLILFKSSEVQHTATGTTHESQRLALGPVALDKAKASPDSTATSSTNSFRSRILSWGSSNSNSGSIRSSGGQYMWIAVSAAFWTMGYCAS